MTFVGCDLHTRTRLVAVLDTRTGEMSEHQLAHEGAAVEEFYAALPQPVTVGVESTGYAWPAPTPARRLSRLLAGCLAYSTMDCITMECAFHQWRARICGFGATWIIVIPISLSRGSTQNDVPAAPVQ
jgi:hypothetical protein